MSRVQLANLTDEELLRYAYIERNDFLVQELCARLGALLDTNLRLSDEVEDLTNEAIAR